jgi:hypothetical protein
LHIIILEVLVFKRKKDVERKREQKKKNYREKTRGGRKEKKVGEYPCRKDSEREKGTDCK